MTGETTVMLYGMETETAPVKMEEHKLDVAEMIG